MSFWKRKPKTANSPEWSDVVDYMVGLDEPEHKKLIKVVKVYRDANTKADKIMGDEDEDLETEAAEFIQPPTPTSNPKKVEIKDDEAN